ncbi:MAG: hypothetical protein ACK46Y_04010 [Fluviicola sp.]
MENLHHKYVIQFIQSGTEKFADLGFLIVPEIVGGDNGLTSINLINEINPELNLVVRFADNRLDYNIGVIVYKTLEQKINSNNMFLPESINSESDTYGYMGQNMPIEVDRLIKDICNKLFTLK